MTDPAATSGAHPEVERQLAELDAIRRRVLNVVGHALRTPVATLRGLVEVLDADPETAARAEVVPALVRTTRRLERLLDDVLLASEVTTRMPTAAAAPQRVADTVGQVWGELGTPGALTVSGDTDAHASIGSDALRWILWHLLDNAARYGEGPVHVELGRDDAQVTVRIGSDGPDLPDADLVNAFELFYRGERAVTEFASGMGVGLPVARRLAEHAGGCVDLCRRGSGGAEAVLQLPGAEVQP